MKIARFNCHDVLEKREICLSWIDMLKLIWGDSVGDGDTIITLGQWIKSTRDLEDAGIKITD